ncbi:hypothetical protein Tco_0927633 [Tanacetum coccineum]
MLHELGEVNPVHTYYNGFRTSKDNEDPSWSISFKTSRPEKTSSALEVLWKTLFVLYLYLLGTFALDNTLVAPENQRVIGKCNMRINPGMKPKEPTYQVVLDALALTTCYPAFLITAEVPVIYMHQFWATVNKHNASYRFKIDNKRFFVNVEVFRDILNICPRILGQEFDEPISKEEALSFIRELGHFGEIKYITNVIVDHLDQPWRTFTSIINKCLCGKVSGLDKIRLSRVQILWGMYYKKNLDFVALFLKDLAYQIDNKDSKKQDKMLYPRFTKIIIHYFLEKYKSISMRNRMFMDTTRDDNLLGTMRFVSRHEDAQIYGVILPKAMINQAMLDYVAYKTYYAIASGAEPLNSSAQGGVPDEQQSKISGTDEGTGTKQGVPDVPKYDSESDKESWGDSGEEDDDDEDDTKDDEGNYGDDSNGNDDDDDNNGDDDDDNDGNDDDDSDQERTESDKDDEENEEESDDGEELYKDVNVNLRKEDVEMTNVDQGGADQHNVSQESGFEQEEEDAHVTLTTVYDTQKTKGPMQSSSILSDFIPTSSQHVDSLLFDNVSSADNEIASLMDTTVRTKETNRSDIYSFYRAYNDFSSVFKFNDRVTKLESDLLEIKQVEQEESQVEKQEYIDLVDTSVRTIIREEVKTQPPQILPKAVSDFATPVIERNVTESLEAAVLAKSSSQPKSTYEAAASLSEYELTKILLDKMQESKSHLIAYYKRKLYDALVKSYNTGKDLFNTYGEVFTLKRSRDNKDKDRDPSAGSDRGTKRRNSSKDVESSRDTKSKDSKSTSSSKGTSRSQHKSSSKSAHAEETNRLNIANLTQDLLVGLAFDLLKGTCKSRTELEYHFEECFKATTERLDWHKPKGKQYPFDLRKPLPLIPNHRGRHVIPFDYFINNDLEYLKGGCLSRKYTTSVTKTKAATYEVQWIEDMVHNIWSPVKVVYDKHAYWGTSHWVTRLTIMKWYDYGHLVEIEVCREDQQLYTFKEGVESYQKKLNLTKPDTFRQNLRNRTAYSDPQGVIYEDQNNRNRLMRTDKLHKFSDGTLNYVLIALHDISSGIRMDYLPKRKWSNLDKRRARVMIRISISSSFKEG